MHLNKLINQGELIEENAKKELYSTKALKEKGGKWIYKSISYLKENYPESVLTNDFISQSEKVDKNYHSMIAILKGLKDVEDELGFLD